MGPTRHTYFTNGWYLDEPKPKYQMSTQRGQLKLIKAVDNGSRKVNKKAVAKARRLRKLSK